MESYNMDTDRCYYVLASSYSCRSVTQLHYLQTLVTVMSGICCVITLLYFNITSELIILRYVIDLVHHK